MERFTKRSTLLAAAAAAVAAAATTAAGCGGNPLGDEAASASPPPASGVGEETAALTGIIINPPIVIDPPPIVLCGNPRLNLSPQGSFDFDAGSTSGWQVSGLFDGDTATRIIAIGPAAATFWDSEDAGGSASNSDGRGSAWVLGASSGLPRAPSGWWRQDFISPDLSANNSWQRSTTTFAIRDDITFDGPALQAQVVLEVRKCDGTTAFRRQVDANGNAVFCPVARSGAWTTCSSTVSLANVDRVLRVHVRTFGPSGYSYEGGVFIDQVRTF